MRIGLVLLILSIVLIPSLGHIAAVSAQPITLTVDPRGQGTYKTIQEAINDANTSDTVFVVNGTYFENLYVNKSISLIGEDKETTTIDGRQFSNVVAIVADNVTIKGFHVRNSGTYRNNSAIMIEQSSGNLIAQNIISGGGYGIGIYTSTNNTITDNLVADNSYADIVLYASTNNTISYNTISGNSDGIGFHASTNNAISNNLVSVGLDGISLDTSIGNTISSNIISNCWDGIGFYTSGNNIVIGNSIYLNNKAGVSLQTGSGDNIFYHNNLNNTVQIMSSESVNLWNFNNEGNYWSDFNGTDHDEDGLGDMPYSIDQSNQDNYPLMGAFSSYDMFLDSGPYKVEVISNLTVADFQFEIGFETGNKIVNFNVTSQEGAINFCRVRIPIALADYPSFLLVGGEKSDFKTLNVSDPTSSYVYFVSSSGNCTVSVISSRTQYLLDQLSVKYLQLQATLDAQNSTHDALLNLYNDLLNNYSQLRQDHEALNASYNEHLSAYLESTDYRRNLLYIFAAATGIFLASMVYLSKKAHSKPSGQS